MKKKLIVGNWKMNGSLAANAALIAALKDGMAQAGDASCGVAGAVPAPDRAQVQALVEGSRIALASQDVSQQAVGA